MEIGFHKTLLGMSVVLAVGAAGGLITSTALLSNAYQSKFQEVRKNEQILNVTGSARRRICSDLAIWHIQVSGKGKDLKEAYAVLKAGYERVEKFLNDAKFTSEEIASSPIDSQKHYAKNWRGQQTEEVVAYTLSRSFTISTSRVGAVAKPASQVTNLIEEGVNVVSEAPHYHYTKLADLKIQMIGEASKDARDRADQIVKNAGCRIASVRNARVGVLQITQPESTEVSDSGIHDTSVLLQLKLEKRARGAVDYHLTRGPRTCQGGAQGKGRFSAGL